jgi:hypothetical protein
MMEGETLNSSKFQQADSRGGSDNWITPKHVIHAFPGCHGYFHIDPCYGFPRPWATALDMWDREGLDRKWPRDKRVWLNPPYSTAKPWVETLADHGHGVTLIFARTDTKLWQETIFPKAHGALFLAGRLRFCYPDGSQSRNTSGAPSCLVAFGQDTAEVLKTVDLKGHFVRFRDGQGKTLSDVRENLCSERQSLLFREV